MQTIVYGRRRLAFCKGNAVHTGTTLTVRAVAGEDEVAFTRRLLAECAESEGTIEIVFRAGVPEYAIVTITSQHSDNAQCEA
ncbi:MAG: hypothetical protein RRC07_11030 [Anaerolineae bacterium]|nr:hypothetical protein [Anaerolineae bacterium]